MNTSLATERSLDRDEQQIVSDELRQRLSALDRLSLRLGLWLLLRSTRRLHRRHDHDAHERARLAQRARDARDHVTIHHARRTFGV